MQSIDLNKGSVVPARLPMRVVARVKSWLEFKSYGFLDATPTEIIPIFVHAKQVPVRMGIGHRLLAGERVIVTYEQQDDGRLRATKIEFE